MTALLIRCDGGDAIGLGHVSRCLSLAEAVEECGVRATFVGRFGEAARQMIADAGFAWEAVDAETGGREDIAALQAAANRLDAKLVVLDSYAIDRDYVAAVNERIASALVVDDFGALPDYPCWGILNPTVCAKQFSYGDGGQQRFLGSEFLLVRRALRKLRPQNVPPTGDVHRVLVAIGGFDRYDLTYRVVEALTAVANGATVHAVVGRSYANGEKLEALLRRCGSESRLRRQLPNLGEEFAAADLCVCGGGMTKDESAYMGVPTIVLSQTDDQDQETKEFARCGLAVDFGLGDILTEDQLRERLAAVIADRPMRERLRRAAWATFPADTMRTVAETAVKIINERVERQ